MTLTNLQEANELVLRRIGDADGEMILGFLPLSEAEENAVLQLVKEQLHMGMGSSINALLRIAPAATAYALAVAPSRSNTTGGKFFPGLSSDLGLDIPVAKREVFAASFMSTCARLGLLSGTIEGTGFKNPAPFIFQAGILHYWKDALARGLRTTLNTIPAPDLEDDEHIIRFVQELGRHVYNQPILSRALETAIGPLLVRRLIIAYLQDDDSALPPHLREPLRESFQTAGRGVVLRGPFLSYDPAFDQIEMVLPAQSSRIATPDTIWQVDGHIYAARSETRIPLDELKKRQPKISLQNLAGSYGEQIFQLDARLDDDVPFRIFREDSMRERRSDAGKSCSVPAGDYLVVMSPDVHAGEDESDVEDHHGYRVLRHMNLRPGDEPVELAFGDRHWDISCAVRSGVFVDRERSSTTQLESGELLHYGSEVGLVAYFPVTEESEPDYQLSIRCPDQRMEQLVKVQSADERNQVYVFTENINAPLSETLEELPPGIHRIELALSHASRRVEHAFWYWKGLNSISESRGFECSQFPENLNLTQSKGIVKGSGGDISFQDGYHAPRITIALTSPQLELVLPRAGVQAILISPGDDWEEEPTPDDSVIVLKDDRRVLRFRSGGFQKWEIRCGDRLVSKLDSNRTSSAISLAGLCQNFGGSGVIVARREDGERLPLLTFSRPLTASAPKFQQDHGKGIEQWSFSISTEELFEIAVQVTDLSDQPDTEPESAITLTFALNEFSEATHDLGAGLSITTAATENKGNSFVKVTVTLDAEALRDRFLLLDFLRRAASDSPWVPLRCTERHGYSSVRLVAMGGKLPDESATWWHRLRSARRVDNNTGANQDLGQALKSLTPEELNRGLIACRHLLDWKYPTSVWATSANRFQDFPVHLGRHRFNIGDGTAERWWNQGAAELSEYAASREAPVARQFVFGSQPACLRIPSTSTEVGSGRHFATPVGRSLNLTAEIQLAGGLLPFAQGAFHTRVVSEDAFFAFQNFAAVSTGRGSCFGQFEFTKFLNGLYQKTEDLADTSPRVQADSLLSPEHLLLSVRAINRRCRPLESVSSTDDSHPLASIAQLVEKLYQKLPMAMPPISRRLGISTQFKDPYEEDNYVFWWSPPCLENRWGQKVSDVVWALSAVSRLGANGIINPTQFTEWLGEVLHTTTERGMQNRICVLLSLAPELFSFYVALFDIAFSESKSN